MRAQAPQGRLRVLIGTRANEVLVSLATLWEIAIKIRTRRVVADYDAVVEAVG